MDEKKSSAGRIGWGLYYVLAVGTMAACAWIVATRISTPEQSRQAPEAANRVEFDSVSEDEIVARLGLRRLSKPAREFSVEPEGQLDEVLLVALVGLGGAAFLALLTCGLFNGLLNPAIGRAVFGGPLPYWKAFLLWVILWPLALFAWAG